MTAMIIIRLAIFVLAFILLRWFLKQLMGGTTKPQTSGKSSSPGGDMVKDPICGMYMDPRLAIKHKMNNGIFYFCSEECKEKFLGLTPGEGPGEPATKS
ncbi:MAG: hypothetical protein P8Z37_13100 [Acidobacteriota bacterium]|jgi:uncharacterized protein